jgi:hypothetical protein
VPAFGVSETVARGVIGRFENARTIGNPLMDKSMLRSSLKVLWFKSWGFTQLEQKQAKNND